MTQEPRRDPVIVRLKHSEEPHPEELIDIRVIPRELFVRGQMWIMKVIKSGKTEGLTISQIAEMTNISERGVRARLHDHAITTVSLGPQSLRSLKDAGVLLVHTRRAIFVPKEGVQKLLRHIGTSESLAIYYQLWTNSEKLEEVEAKLLDTVGKLKAALDQSAVQAAKIRAKEQEISMLMAQISQQNQQIVEIGARLQAADHHIALGGNKKLPKFSIPIYRREPNDIFDNPVYSIVIAKKSRSEMNADEALRFSGYHATRTMVGLSYAAEKSFRQLGVSSETLFEKLVRVQNEVTSLKDEIEPNVLGLNASNKSERNKYLTDRTKDGIATGHSTICSRRGVRRDPANLISTEFDEIPSGQH